MQTVEQPPLKEQVKSWTVKKLEKELTDIRYHMDNFSVGRWEFWYEDLLVKELEERDKNGQT